MSQRDKCNVRRWQKKCPVHHHSPPPLHPLGSGYGGFLALLSITLRFWDLFVVRAVLYPIYIANAPHAGFEHLNCRPLPVFQPALAFFNGAMQLANLYIR